MQRWPEAANLVQPPAQAARYPIVPPRGWSVPRVRACERAWHGQPTPLRAILRDAMSSNLDLVRSIYADWERGDWSSADWADPAIEFNIADGPVPVVVIGVAAMAESWQQWLSAWEHFSLAVEEYRELDSERVLVLTRYGGCGKTSGADIGEMWTNSATLLYVRDGKVTKLVGYNARERALADLGLEE